MTTETETTETTDAEQKASEAREYLDSLIDYAWCFYGPAIQADTKLREVVGLEREGYEPFELTREALQDLDSDIIYDYRQALTNLHIAIMPACVKLAEEWADLAVNVDLGNAEPKAQARIYRKLFTEAGIADDFTTEESK